MPIAKINRQGIFFEDSGTPKEKSWGTIIFMHGFLMDQSVFDSQVQTLLPRYRCVRWDARGFGKTEWDEKPFNLYDSVSDCLGLMDYLGIDSAVLAGVSQGGYCALRAALKAPKRVNGLVLISTRSECDEEPSKAYYREIRDTWLNAGPVDLLIEALATAIIGPRQAPGVEALWNRWLPRWAKTSGDAIYHGINNLLDRDEITHRLSEITCPAMMIHGTEDIAIPIGFAESLSKGLQDCRDFVRLPGAHALTITHPDILNSRLLRFLDGIFGT